LRRGPRYEARQKGLKRYFTGEPCENGHVCERMVSNCRCLQCNAEIVRAYDCEKKRAYVNKSRRINPERTLIQDRQSHARHREKRNAYSREYNKRNRDRLNANQREWKKTWPIESKLGVTLRSRLLLAIKNGQRAGSAVRDLGCSVKQLKNYIAAKFQPGMSWNNHGKVWQLDHIQPVCKFDLTKREQFLVACNYTNLQPLTIEQHKIKTRLERRTGG
jgi:hypothetical protein